MNDRFKITGVILSLILTLSAARATEYTWVATNAANWGEATNWSPVGIPADADAANITNGGVVNVAGSFNVGTLRLSSGTIADAGSGVLQLTNGLWTGGTNACPITIPAGGVYSIAGEDEKDFSAGTSIHNSGTITWTGGGNIIATGGEMLNYAGASFEIQGDALMADLGGGFTIYNYMGSVLRKTNSAGTSVIDLLVYNYGLVDVQSGTLEFYGCGIYATLNTAEGATTKFSHFNSLFSNASLTGTGITLLAEQNDPQHAYTFQGTISSLNLVFGGGAIEGSFTLNGTMEWTNGTIRAYEMDISPGSALNINGPAEKYIDGGSLIFNSGTVVWSGSGDISLDVGVQFFNQPGGVFIAQNDAGLTYPDEHTPGDFSNTDGALFLKTNSFGTTSIGVGLHNYGLVDVQSGTMDIQGCEDFATINTAAGALTKFSHYNHFLQRATFTGAGTTLFSSYDNEAVIVDGFINCQHVVVGGGNIAGDFQLNGKMQWTNGTWLDSHMTVVPGSTLEISGGGDKTISAAGSITNYGDVLWKDTGSIIMAGGKFVNQSGGVITAQNDATIRYSDDYSGGYDFENGTGAIFRKTNSVGTTTANIAFINDGLMDVQSGTLQLIGSFTQGAVGVLGIGIGGTAPGTGFGQLEVGNRATMTGGLSVKFNNGFKPHLNDSFQVLACGELDDGFSAVAGAQGAGGVVLTTNYQATGVTLVAVDGTPKLASTPALTGGQFNAGWTGVLGQTYLVQASTNLTQWTSISTNVLSVNPLQVVEPKVAAWPRRFYRAALLP